MKFTFYYNKNYFQNELTNRLVPAVVAPAPVAPPGADEFSALPSPLQSSREIVPPKLSFSLRITVNEEGKCHEQTYFFKCHCQFLVSPKMYLDVIRIV